MTVLEYRSLYTKYETLKTKLRLKSDKLVAIYLRVYGFTT
jgi:hypothetical protein